jgi:signal transduction histidine kinase
VKSVSLGDSAGSHNVVRHLVAEPYLIQSPVAFAVVRGERHELVYHNAAFASLTVGTHDKTGITIEELFDVECRATLSAMLDRAMQVGSASRDQLIAASRAGQPSMSWTVWPVMHAGEPTHDVVVEVRTGTDAELTLDLQKQVAERMLISALRAADQAEKADAAGARAGALSDASHSLTMSLDESEALGAVAALHLPQTGSWCIVDIFELDGSMCRQPIVHRDPRKRVLAAKLARRWSPESGDSFGLPAVETSWQHVLIEPAESILATVAHTQENLAILRQLDIGSLLTVSLVSRGHLLGAITFVSERSRGAFSAEDIQHATDLATRSAMALDSARSYGQAILLRAKADIANEMKTAFLGAMSHELRTPLNAIGGFVDLMDMGLRGAVTDEQHGDLGRIRANQQHLLGLINEILNFVKVGSGQVTYHIVDVPARDLLAHAVALVEPLFAQNGLEYTGIECKGNPIARADVEKVHQILVNLLSNAIKFTLPNGRVSLGCAMVGNVVWLTVSDTGIGISPDKLLTIFEPFVQIKNSLAGRTSGVGLGLAISRDLARAMHGDLLAASDDKGSVFTLTLPAAARQP